MNVAAEPVELSDDDGATPLARRRQGGGEFGPTLERVGPLAGLDLGELLSELVTLGLGESLDCGLLRLQPEAGTALQAESSGVPALPNVKTARRWRGIVALRTSHGRGV
jgi:hypothetical protein